MLSPGAKLWAGEEKGQALVEEAIILALITIVGLGALAVLQSHVTDAITSLLTSLGALDPGARRGGS